MGNREENIRLLQMAAEGKLSAEDLIYRGEDNRFRIWLNFNNGNEMYIGPLINNQPPPKSPNPRYKIMLNLNK